MLASIFLISLVTGCTKMATDKDEQGRTIISIGGWPDKNGELLDKMNEKNQSLKVKTKMWL